MRAIDFHVHPADWQAQVDLFGEEGANHFYGYFRAAVPATPMSSVAAAYRERGLGAVLLALDAGSETGRPGNSSESVAACVRADPDVFVGFASVDPWRGKTALAQLRHAIEDLGLCGLKLHPIAQGFSPNERRFYPLWETCVELGIPVLLHTGQTGWGAGTPGGSGAKLGFGRPIPFMDDVAADFPELTVVLAHPSFPWENEAISMALHKTNVYIDLSGWSPKYFPPVLVDHVRTLLQDKAMFGSDYPAIHPDQWLRAFADLNLPDTVREKVLWRNACKVLTHPNSADFIRAVTKANQDAPDHERARQG